MLDIVTVICSHLGPLINSCFSLDMFYQFYGLSTTMLIDHIEPIIRAILEMTLRISTELNNTGFDYSTLTQIHTNLTSHILYNQFLISLLQDKILHSVGSPHLNQMQDLLLRLSDTSRGLLFQYRDVEHTLGITLANSPISN